MVAFVDSMKAFEMAAIEQVVQTRRLPRLTGRGRGRVLGGWGEGEG